MAYELSGTFLVHAGQKFDEDAYRQVLGFLRARFPWIWASGKSLIEGLSVEEACLYLWDEARCPLLHRFGARHEAELQSKVGNIFSLTEEQVELIEVSAEPPTVPAVARDSRRTVIWIETVYWG